MTISLSLGVGIVFYSSNQLNWKYVEEKGTHRVWNFINIHCPFICNIKENIICFNSLFSLLLIPVGSKSLIQSGVNCYGTIIKWKFEKEGYTSLIDGTKQIKSWMNKRKPWSRWKVAQHQMQWEEILRSRKNLPKYEVNPLMQMSRYILTLQSHPVLMHKINWILSPSRKSYRIW